MVSYCVMVNAFRVSFNSTPRIGEIGVVFILR